MREINSCHDCGVRPGEIHHAGCDVERCSVCGLQKIGCACEGHDPAFSRWSGFWPGGLESDALGIDLNEFLRQGYHLRLFVRPPLQNVPAPTGKRGEAVRKAIQPRRMAT